VRCDEYNGTQTVLKDANVFSNENKRDKRGCETENKQKCQAEKLTAARCGYKINEVNNDDAKESADGKSTQVEKSITKN
jgi:hypothetical protein